MFFLLPPRSSKATYCLHDEMPEDASLLPSLSATHQQWSPSPFRGRALPETAGCYISPITRQPHAGLGLPILCDPATPTSKSPSMSSNSSCAGSSTDRVAERFSSPTGFNRPVAIGTKIQTVRRMFHYATPSDRKRFYEAFLDRPCTTPK